MAGYSPAVHHVIVRLRYHLMLVMDWFKEMPVVIFPLGLGASILFYLGIVAGIILQVERNRH